MDNDASFTLASWNFSLLRMTAFPIPMYSYEARVDEWWKEIVGDYPDTITQNPKVGLSHAEGLVKHGLLIIENQANRIDVVMSEKVEDLQSVSTQAPIKFIDALEFFQSVTQKWLNLFNGPILSRLAFGAKLVQPVPSKEDAYKLLQKYLHHLEIDPVNTSELLYRINRPRPSKTNSNIIINRLTTWAVERSMIILFPITNPHAGGQQKNGSTNCSLELDINNKPEFQLSGFDVNSLELFEELIGLGKEIAVAGDIQ